MRFYLVDVLGRRSNVTAGTLFGFCPIRLAAAYPCRGPSAVNNQHLSPNRTATRQDTLREVCTANGTYISPTHALTDLHSILWRTFSTHLAQRSAT
jgi:hypothetical protein